MLRGSIVPLVTPFRDGEVDGAAFEAAVERQVAEGSDGVVVTGTTGEPTSLSVAERADLFRRAADVAAGRIAVVAATGSANHLETLELTAEAERAAVDAVLVVCPPFVKPSQDGLVEHMVAAAARTELPFLIYNIPGRSGVGISAESVERVASRAPNLAGLKHASKDLDLVTDLLLRLGDDFRLFCGVESFSYPFLAVGGAGLMSAVGNLLPGPVADLCARVREGDHDEALKIHRALFRINQAVFFETNPVPLKVMLAAAGLGSEEVRLPLAPASADTRRRLADLIPVIEAYASGGVA
jgi:4-hydroxy-tetrahydrodipicolinate synthase